MTTNISIPRLFDSCILVLPIVQFAGSRLEPIVAASALPDRRPSSAEDSSDLDSADAGDDDSEDNGMLAKRRERVTEDRVDRSSTPSSYEEQDLTEAKATTKAPEEPVLVLVCLPSLFSSLSRPDQVERYIIHLI